MGLHMHTAHIIYTNIRYTVDIASHTAPFQQSRHKIRVSDLIGAFSLPFLLSLFSLHPLNQVYFQVKSIWIEYWHAKCIVGTSCAKLVNQPLCIDFYWWKIWFLEKANSDLSIVKYIIWASGFHFRLKLNSNCTDHEIDSIQRYQTTNQNEHEQFWNKFTSLLYVVSVKIIF